MTSFLFWNIMKKDLREIVARAVKEHDVDIIMLAEAGMTDNDMIQALIGATSRKYASLSLKNDKVRIFTRLAESLWTKKYSGTNGRIAIWSVDVGQNPGVLLAAVHFISKMNATTNEQGQIATGLAKEIRFAEDSVGHNRTILVGDLNMNPFDSGLIGANALHAVMCKSIAEKRLRVAQGERYTFFYNPMWGHFGDRTNGPPGTYYHPSPSFAELFWHMFDQVLLRPELMDLLRKLTILDVIDGDSLTTKHHIPNSVKYSDHLPVLFQLHLD